MKFELICNTEYESFLDATRYKKRLISPNEKYEIRETLAGNFLRGDNHSHLELINLEDEKLIWELKKETSVREINRYPWTADSKYCYFEVVEKGGKIIYYDCIKNKISTALFYKDRLNHIDFLSKKLKGAILLTYPYHSEIGKDWKYLYHNPLTNETVGINEILKQSEPIRVFESPIIDSILVVDISNIYLIDITKRSVTTQKSLPVKLDNKAIHWNMGFVANNEIILQLFPNQDNQEGVKYKLKLPPTLYTKS